MNKFLISIMSTVVIVVSCNNSDPQGSEHEANIELNPIITDPTQFIPFVQEVIALDSMELLRELCHPDPTRIRFNNANTLCNIAYDDMSQVEKCKNWFGNSSVVGDITIDGDTARVPAQLGGGDRHPTIILEKQNERWYLVGMEWHQ